ncbi:MAG: TIGR04086 family membrane protein [Ruminococcus sp.]
MKAIKTTFFKSGITLYIKAVTAGIIAATIVCLAMLLIVSLILLISGILPKGILVWVGVVVSALSAFTGGYVSARITKSNGLLVGAVCGAVIFLILFIAGLAGTEDNVSYITFVKLIAVTICSALGGIKGVNKKDKIRIK